MNYLLTPEAPDHLPLATLPCLPEQCNHCGKNISRQSSLYKHMVVVHGASRPSKILQDLAKLMARWRISFFICYIAFKNRISFKKHMKRVDHCNVYEKAFKSLQMPNQNIIWQHSGYVFVCKGCGKKFKTNNSIYRPKKLFHFKSHHSKSFCNFSMWGKEGGRKRTGLSSSRKRADILCNLSWKYIFFFHTQNCKMYIFRIYFNCFWGCMLCL